MGKTIAVTGANGFIGTALIKHLHAAGHKVIALVHRMPEKKVKGMVYHLYDLKNAPDTTLFTNVDVLIHLAFSFAKPAKGEADLNLMAAKNLLDLRLKHYIFVSSFSATANAIAYYGQCKYELEKVFVGHTIIRPGLVVGDGGLFLRLRKQLAQIPFVPLFAGGRQPMQLIALGDLVTAIANMAVNPTTGVFNLAYPKAITYKEMIKLASSATKAKPIFIPVPIFLMRGLIRVLRLFGKHDISEDNLDGLLDSRVISTAPDLDKIDLKLLLTKELIEG